LKQAAVVEYVQTYLERYHDLPLDTGGLKPYQESGREVVDVSQISDMKILMRYIPHFSFGFMSIIVNPML
jgi:hypothetical protein